jgi:ubiquinone/menaquinone biosynthesis C-methylase UbiE
VVEPELLDADAGTPEEVAASLADLRLVNRWFGGAQVTVRLLERVAEETGLREVRLLDVAGAGGDVPAAARAALAKRGVRLEVTVLDRAAAHLARSSGTQAVVGDAFSLPFADHSFHVVSSSLFVHHLEPEEVARFMKEALRVGRTAVLINDLLRHPVHWALARAGAVLYRSRLTRHDAPVSVRRAYTPREMQAMLARTGARQVEISRHYLYRMGVIAWR